MFTPVTLEEEGEGYVANEPARGISFVFKPNVKIATENILVWLKQSQYIYESSAFLTWTKSHKSLKHEMKALNFHIC